MDDIGILQGNKTAFVLIDVQEKFMPVIDGIDRVISNSNMLIKASEILKIPLVVTEQYPKGLGKTIDEIKLPGKQKIISKVCFSCFGSDEFEQELEKLDPENLVLFGIESHVCVLRTALDALERGFSVHIAADAVSSRNPENSKLALERMRQAGAFISPAETIVFQLIDAAGTEEFRKISELVKRS